MDRIALALVGMAPVLFCRSVLAKEPDTYGPALERETLTGAWWGTREHLEEKGIELTLGLTQVFQQNAHGGLDTERGAAGYSGSYDLEIDVDLEELAGLAGASVSVLVQGSWSEGIDERAVGSVLGVNDAAGGYRSADVTQLYYEQALADGRVRIRVGKLSLTGGFECRGCPVTFDGNSYANDETAQFLNAGLVNNPTIPFPDEGLGIVVYVEPVEGFYAAAGVADAQADARETGFHTAFHGEDALFTIFETGLVPVIPSANGPLVGAYRFGAWHDSRSKGRLDGGGTREDDVGFYVSFDQVLYREGDQDDQGLAAFARWGSSDKRVNEIGNFWSAGIQYRGLLSGRDADVVGIGVAEGRLSRYGDFSARDETVVEGYWSVELTPWLVVSPNVQVIRHPGGDRSVKDAVVVGCRVQAAF